MIGTRQRVGMGRRRNGAMRGPSPKSQSQDTSPGQPAAEAVPAKATLCPRGPLRGNIGRADEAAGARKAHLHRARPGAGPLVRRGSERPPVGARGGIGVRRQGARGVGRPVAEGPLVSYAALAARGESPKPQTASRCPLARGGNRGRALHPARTVPAGFQFHEVVSTCWVPVRPQLVVKSALVKSRFTVAWGSAK